MAHMRAAAGLQINRRISAANSHQADAPGAAWRLDGKRAHQAGIGIKLGFCDPFLRDGMIGGDQRIQGFGQAFLGGRFRQIEIKARFLKPDLPTRDTCAGDQAA